jgi:N-hydroxyarylamine O-acetyltransferase
MNYTKYLERIGFQGKPEANLNTLISLQKKHLYSIPFENLDIHTGKKIVLDINLFEDKIINNKRGGFCYELNGLFYELLKEIGFDVTMISARVYNDDEIPGDEFDHMALLVKFGEDEYLSDVGFGDSFIEPLWFNPDFVNEDEAGFFQIVKEDDTHFKLLKSEDGVYFTPKYIFSKKARILSDYTEACEYTQTSPKSHFTKNKLCSIAGNGGRITLINDKLIITENGSRKESAVRSGKEFNDNLLKYFGIKL